MDITLSTPLPQKTKAEGTIRWIDVAKAICIIGMVLGHSGFPYTSYIYMFHMPAFLILSGYTYSGEKYTLGSYIKKKIYTLVLPYIIVNLGFIFLYKVLHVIGIYNYFNPAPYIGVKESLYIFFLYTGTPDFGGATWFLLVLFFAEAGFKLIQTCFNFPKQDLLIALLAGMLGFFSISQGIILPYMLDLGLYAVLFFAIGVFFRRYNIFARINLTYSIPLSIIMVYFFGKYYFNGVMPMNWPTRQFANPIIQVVSVLACFCICYGVSLLILRYESLSKCFIFIGRHTYSILILHFLVFRLLTGLLVLVGVLPVASLQGFPLPSELVPYWLFTVSFSVAVCLLIAWAAKRFAGLNYIVNAAVPPGDYWLFKLQARLKSKIDRSSFLRYIVYAGLLFFCYAIILKFVFPGYFEPLIPHHSDILDYPYDFLAGGMWHQILRGSRPIGGFLTWFFGLFGAYKGVMVSGIIATFLSVLFTVFCVEKELDRKPSYIGIITYFFFILSSSSFYLNYTFDMYNVYALLFATLTLFVWYKGYGKKGTISVYILVLLLSLLNFLSKETYIISILFFFFVKAILEKKDMRKKAIVFLVVSGVSAAFTLLRSRFLGDVFAGMAVIDETHPYYSSTAISSMMKTFRFYIQGFSNPWVVTVLLAAIVLLFMYYKEKKQVLSVCALAISGLLSYVPYLVLPNRTVPHSFFIAYVLAFSPMIALSPVLFKKMIPNKTQLASTILVIFIGICATNSVLYNNGGHGFNSYQTSASWLTSEKSMKATLESSNWVNSQMKPNDVVLVRGLEDYVESGFRGYNANKLFREDVQFYVVTNVQVFAGPIAPNVEYVYAEELDQLTYNVVLTYTVPSDGTMPTIQRIE